MQHRRYNHRLPRFGNFIDDAIGEAVWVTPSDVLVRMTPTIEEWVFGQCIAHADDFLCKLHPQPRLTRFIPCGSFGYILFHFRPKLDLPVHFPKRERKRAFISASATAEAGFR